MNQVGRKELLHVHKARNMLKGAFGRDDPCEGVGLDDSGRASDILLRRY